MSDLDEGCICGEEHKIWVPYDDDLTDEEFEAMTEKEYSVHFDKLGTFCAGCQRDVTFQANKERLQMKKYLKENKHEESNI